MHACGIGTGLCPITNKLKVSENFHWRHKMVKLISWQGKNLHQRVKACETSSLSSSLIQLEKYV